ncbi:AMP-binding protein [Rhizorhabdus sp. FW153]|uniref:AMP-binding protein n=1 Tax=Rhizorhabdus sp. FW153 TaxID=3400216 RepID=UPI003CEC0733
MAAGGRVMLSQVRGGDTPPLLDITIGELLAETAARQPDAPALIVRHQNVRLTYAELLARVDALARGLIGAGLRPGERIGIWSPNCVEWVLVQFAAARAGLVLVNINPAYRAIEMQRAAAMVGCAALVIAPRFKSSDYVAMLAEVRADLPDLRLVLSIGEGEHQGCRLLDTLPSDPATPLPGDVKPRDATNIQFTSGTTGLPKGATLSHRNIVNNGYMVGRRIGLSPADIVCIPVPLYHCFGMVMGNLACVAHGATMCLPGDAFDPATALAAVAEERCTALYGVPTMFVAMLEHPGFAGFDLRSLRTGIMAGSLCPTAIMQAVLDRMHMREVTIAYGMTETSPVSFQSAMDDPLELRVSTVGQVQPHLEAKVVDLDGKTVAVGEPGELCTRGYSVMLGYWDDPEKTAQVIDAEGWMHTGDLATIDEQGYCRIVGRIKDMIIRGGENIYPREIEEHLLTHPDVVDAQVFGVPDDRFGEEVCAWVIARSTTLSEGAVIEHCRGRIAHYKVPRHVRLVPAFPLTVTGKVQKFMMREAMAAELAPSD